VAFNPATKHWLMSDDWREVNDWLNQLPVVNADDFQVLIIETCEVLYLVLQHRATEKFNGQLWRRDVYGLGAQD